MLTTKEMNRLADGVAYRLRMSDEAEQKKRMDIVEAAKFVGMSEAWMKYQTQRGNIRSYRFGRKSIFLKGDLVRLMETMTKSKQPKQDIV